MASPMPMENADKSKIINLLSQLETEFRWCAQHPNDVSDFELEQLKESIEYFDKNVKDFGGKFYNDFAVLKKIFDNMADYTSEIKPGDSQKIEDMLQKLFQELK